ncbi:bifunctional diguanylate cyclase/phosphodiesterase [Actinoplanes sp. NBRC 101535]|uniref:putative bifunctional diguanylate cyclase/phosphodiesterase n=1 Tax=Actinoplanes sp. NBRC 101535 TaxID=3032196 RepID=UPI0024A1024A|nr:bifunctional diguanylate cyclase/phosphodiesterase [Actinoplanes sp. NBRC 101535]GLX99662.1 hypothetical protein Acsp01_00420 [Actinoplanes sp. NBRC 101535]
MTRPPSRAADTARKLFFAAAGWTVLSALLMIVGASGPPPVWLLWPSTAAVSLTAALTCAVAARSGRGPVRDFWRGVTVTTALVTGGVVAQAVDAAVTGDSSSMGPVTAALYVLAVTVGIITVVRLPRRRRTWRAAVAVHLDVAVVGVAAALVITHVFHSAPGPSGPGVSDRFVAILVGAAVAAVVAVIKVGVTGSGPVHAPSIWALAPIGLVTTAALLLEPRFAGMPHLASTVVTMPVIGLLIAFSAYLQTHANVFPAPPRTPPLPAERRGAWRRISLVPYAAVAGTTTMLVVVTSRTGYLPPTLAGGSVLLTVLIVVRQLTALSENRVLLDRLADQAYHDDLTGLPNRRLFTVTLARRLDRTTVAVCDLDGFASLNDQLGDETGDALLRAAAARVAAVAGPDAMVARLLGDEFGVVLPGDGDRIAERLLEAFRSPLCVDDRDLLVTVTVGAASGDGDECPDLLRRAELALQAAKYTGANRFREHTRELDATAQHHAELAAALRRGLECDEFHLVYQPIVELPSGSIAGVEALLRWKPTNLPPMSPAEFIPVAEHSGLIIDLGAWVIDTACADAAVWQRRYGTAGPRVNINVSARQLLDPELPAQVSAALQRHGLSPDRITVEITETAVFAGGAAMSTVRELRELGVGLALDDFGTGHSSLTLLRTCPVTSLKVDKSFIDDLGGGAEREAIASSLSTIAATLGLRAVAEGVETRDQAERLHTLGYRYAQGYYFARPAPANEIDIALGEPAAAL